MKFFVYSTVTTDVKFVDYEYVANTNEQRERDSVVIKGGSNTINKRLMTIRGAVVTEVPEEKIGWLRNHAIFKAMERNGYLTIEESSRAEDGEKVASRGMAGRDGSAMAEYADFGPGGRFHVAAPEGVTGDDGPQRKIVR